MNLIERVKNILISPDAEWQVIAGEPGDVTTLFTRYVAILAAIPALAGFVGGSIIGMTVSVGTFRVPILAGLINMVLGYVFSFVIVYAVALIIDVLAPSFRAERNFSSRAQALGLFLHAGLARRNFHSDSRPAVSLHPRSVWALSAVDRPDAADEGGARQVVLLRALCRGGGDRRHRGARDRARHGRLDAASLLKPGSRSIGRSDG